MYSSLQEVVEEVAIPVVAVAREGVEKLQVSY